MQPNQQVIEVLRRKLSLIDHRIQVVLASAETPGMILPSENSAYAHVYLLNVEADHMLDIEDAAYDVWGSIQATGNRAVCFFMYTAEETRSKFPEYELPSDA